MSQQPSESTATLSPDLRAALSAGHPRPRLWTGILVVAVMWAIYFAFFQLQFTPSRFFFMRMATPMAATVLVCLWWLFASRVRWSDRLLIAGVFIAAAATTLVLSAKTFPFMQIVLWCAPYMLTAWVAWLLVTYRLNWPIRRAGLLAVFLLGFLPYNLLRVDGVTGEFKGHFSLRWSPTPEEQLLTSLVGTPAGETASGAAAAPAETLELAPGDWPGFRGPARDGRAEGVAIDTHWQDTPPRELWRHRIGPGWSSFAVVGHRAYTQEQRGDDELVVCYDLDTGAELWAHHDHTRFTETVAGPGPRATPTFADSRIYAQGANGILNCLDAATGKSIWSRDVVQDSGAAVPMWGFSSSPLVVEGVVSIFAGGPEGKSVLGYQASDGNLAWASGDGKTSYCSPQLARLDGVDQLLLTTELGLTSYQPKSGEVLWFHDWPSEEVARVIQPAVLADGDVLVGTGMSVGTRRVHITHTADAWPTEAIWTKPIKPYYNDLVVDGEYLYGFNGSSLVSAQLADGKVRWSHHDYGNGQVLLLADQHLVLVLTETGEVALVQVEPAKFVEVAQFKAIEGKTWNHPVIAHGKLLVRNGEEVACFELKPAGQSGPPADAQAAE